MKHKKKLGTEFANSNKDYATEFLVRIESEVNALNQALSYHKSGLYIKGGHIGSDLSFYIEFGRIKNETAWLELLVTKIDNNKLQIVYSDLDEDKRKTVVYPNIKNQEQQSKLWTDMFDGLVNVLPFGYKDKFIETFSHDHDDGEGVIHDKSFKGIKVRHDKETTPLDGKHLNYHGYKIG